MEKTRPKILLVEDDLNIGFLTKEYLIGEGFEVELCKDGEAGYEAFIIGEYDLCILDIMMPKMDGFELGKRIRGINSQIPLIFLTAKNLRDDKFIGFNIGADDYITKPFDEEELLWRINAILKRVNKEETVNQEEWQIGRFSFEPLNQLLVIDQRQQRLTERETKVLKLLCKNKGNITRREELLENIWGENDYFAGRSLDVFIAKLRKYLKADVNVAIENIPRVGFVLKD